MKRITKKSQARSLASLIRQVGEFDGFNGRRRKILEFKDSTNVVQAHTCLQSKFSVSFRVGELRKRLANLDDSDTLTVTVWDDLPTRLSFVR